MNVLLILEDTPNDQYIAKPVIEAMFAHLGKAAKVTACQDRMGSVEQATDYDRLMQVFKERGGTVDLFLLLVDRDCRAPDRPHGGNRAASLQSLEERVRNSGELRANQHFIAAQAIEELEVWLLAAFEHSSWQSIRKNCDPKEAFYKSFALKEGVFDEPAQGRGSLMKEGRAKYRTRIRKLCEELQNLEQRIGAI